MIVTKASAKWNYVNLRVIKFSQPKLSHQGRLGYFGKLLCGDRKGGRGTGRGWSRRRKLNLAPLIRKDLG